MNKKFNNNIFNSMSYKAMFYHTIVRLTRVALLFLLFAFIFALKLIWDSNINENWLEKIVGS